MKVLLFFIPCICFALELDSSYSKIKHREYQGIGYKQGYTTIDVHLSFLNHPEFALFLNPRSHVFNDGRFAFNVGLGGRYCFPREKWTLGLNAYYDYRSEKFLSPQQLGIGLELFNADTVFRFNSYKPFNLVKQKTNSHTAVALANLQGEVEKYFFRGTICNFSAAVGAYYLTKKTFHDKTYGKAWGSDMRLTLQLWQRLELLLEITYDHIFHFTFQGMLSLTFPFGDRKKEAFLSFNLYRSVYRNEIIPIEYQ